MKGRVQSFRLAIISRNYDARVSGEIITGNYQLVYYIVKYKMNYRDTAVSKKYDPFKKGIHIHNIQNCYLTIFS